MIQNPGKFAMAIPTVDIGQIFTRLEPLAYLAGDCLKTLNCGQYTLNEDFLTCGRRE